MNMQENIAIGLKGIVVNTTDISLVDGINGHLVYRGYWAKDLALNHDFEEVIYLLWFGKLPNQEELKEFKEQLVKYRNLPERIVSLIKTLPPEMDMMSVLRTAVSSLKINGPDWPPTIEQGIQITSVIPTIIAYRTRLLQGKEIIKPDPTLGHVANYLYMLNGTKPLEAHVRALNAYFVLTAEHGMNASTFTCRVITSTESDLVSAICGAIGAMKGPLHGGAPAGVIKMLDEIGSIDRAESWIRQKLENKEILMGFGHRVYRTRDPRAEALSIITSQLSGEDPWFKLATHVEQVAIKLLQEYKPGRKIYTNVEFFAAAVLKAVGLPTELFTATFTASRVAGWIAHAIEQSKDNKIIRPDSKYTGPMPKVI